MAHQIPAHQAAITPFKGKVERSQRTDLEEFYTTVDLKDPTLVDQLAEGQHYYNPCKEKHPLNA
jgi:hypothetical protein